MSSKIKSAKRVYDSSDEEAQSTKKSKTISTESKKDSEGNTYWELSNARRVQISEFKGKRLINIREFYQKADQFLPGKKGISLTLEQFSAFMTVLPQLIEHLSELGDDVTLPSFSSSPNRAAEAPKQPDRATEESSATSD